MGRNKIGRGSSGCQKGHVVIDAISNAEPIAMFRRTNAASVASGMGEFNAAVQNGGGLALTAGGIDFRGPVR